METITVRMHDLVPHKHGVLVRFEGRTEPTLITVVTLRWCEDGKRMSAILDSHNFIIEDADALLDYVVEIQNLTSYERERVAAWVPPQPPKPKTRCAHCGQEVTL